MKKYFKDIKTMVTSDVMCLESLRGFNFFCVIILLLLIMYVYFKNYTGDIIFLVCALFFPFYNWLYLVIIGD